VVKPGQRSGNKTEGQNLDDIAMFISMDVRLALQAAIVMGVVDLLFLESRDWFWTNPANTLPYSALRALEERSVVHISEVLHDEHKIRPVAADIRQKIELASHRDALSHPVTIRWRRPAMQQFHDQHRKWRDYRPILIWDMQLSINEHLRALGRKPRIEGVPVTPGMAVMLSSILRLSVKAHGQAAIPVEQDLLESLSGFRDRYLDFLVKRSRNPRPKEVRSSKK